MTYARRLPSAALFGLLVLAGCDDEASGAATTTKAPSRVNAVQAAPVEVEAPEAFCDVQQAEAPFRLPQLASAAPELDDRWHWVNVWATWCKPCIEEMPRLTRFQKQLAKDGAKVELLFLSVDPDDETVAKFRAKHPNIPRSLRLSAPDKLEPWMDSLGLESMTVLPIHLFVSPDNQLRCARAGPVEADSYATVSRIVGAEQRLTR